jgi:hypothetical protein
LVPSNFIQRLQGEDLVEFHRAAVLGLQICGDDSSTTSLPRDLLGVSPNHHHPASSSTTSSSHLAGNRTAGHPSIHQLPSHPHQQQLQQQQQQQQGLPQHQQPIAANEPIDQGQFWTFDFSLSFSYLFFCCVKFLVCVFVCVCEFQITKLMKVIGERKRERKKNFILIVYHIISYKIYKHDDNSAYPSGWKQSGGLS